MFESAGRVQEVACVSVCVWGGHLSHNSENSQEGNFFFLECVWGGGKGAVENRFVTKRIKMPQVTSW